MVFTHTEVDPSLSGQGLGSVLAEGALNDAHGGDKRVVPQCEFIARYIERHGNGRTGRSGLTGRYRSNDRVKRWAEAHPTLRVRWVDAVGWASAHQCSDRGGGRVLLPPPGLAEGDRMDGREFVWAHFKLNAEQRLRGFNFFVVLAMFADGGVLAALQQGFSPGLLILLVPSCWRRCSGWWTRAAGQLLELTIAALKEMDDYPELPAVRRRCAGAEPGDQLHLRHPRAAAGADGLRSGCGRLRA